jgi:hypothetical protein
MRAALIAVRRGSAALRLASSILMWAAAAAASAQNAGIAPLYRDQAGTNPVGPAAVPPMKPPQVFTPPPEDSDQRIAEPSAAPPTLREWYESQERPPVAMYFLQRLGRVPPGWYGKYRVVIGASKDDRWDDQSDGKKDTGKETETGAVTLGVERNTEDDGTRSRSAAVGMVESALVQELQAANFHVIDSALVERALVARRGREGDHEYDALAAAARLMLEVEIVGVDTPYVAATLKSLKSGEVVAVARVPVNGRLDSSSRVQSLARAVVRKLNQAPVPLPETSASR